MRELDSQPLMRRSKKYIEVKSTENVKNVLNIIDSLIAGKRFGELDSRKQMYLLDCQTRIQEMQEGRFSDMDLLFLKDTIDSLINLLMATSCEINKYIPKEE